MVSHDKLKTILDRTETYLTQTLLPFWLERSPDPDFGGFLSYFDRHGRPTGETIKTFLMQIRMLYTLSSAHRSGYGAVAAPSWPMGRASSPIITGTSRTTAGSGLPTAPAPRRSSTRSVTVNALASTLSASTSWPPATRSAGRWLMRSYDAVCRHMADTRHGGYLELLNRDWQPQPGGIYGGDRKSLDVHMHMMEALTSFLRDDRAAFSSPPAARR